MSRIYVASSWRNAVQPAVVAALREAGHEVYDFRHPNEGFNDSDRLAHGFHWSEIDPDWQQWSAREYRKALAHPLADRGFEADKAGMEWADTCVLVLPCGRSAHAEAGWMAGQGKATYVLLTGPTEPELMYRLFGKVLVGFDELEEQFAGVPM